jgi:hypothetical protein
LATELVARSSHEAHSPPLYYALAAAWYKLGQFAGLSPPRAAYWVRFFNIPLCIALIVATFGFCRAYFPWWIALTAPMLVAFFPSNMFFCIGSDVLSPLAVLLALWALLRWHDEPANTLRSITAGLAVAAAILVKLTNVAVLVACGVVVIFRILGDRRKSKEHRCDLRQPLLVLVSAGAPLAAWMLRNRIVLGDWTGNADKVRTLGWHVKPWGQLLDHPFFSFAGQQLFWRENIKSYFRGDLFWNGVIAMDYLPCTVFYCFSVLVALIGTAAILIRHRRGADTSIYRVAMLSALMIVVSALLPVWLSLRFDFGDCVYPSRSYPYFTSGRLISGTLVPVLALFAYGVAVVTRRRKLATAAVIGVSVVMMVLPQIAFFAQVVRSPYNWFHIP